MKQLTVHFIFEGDEFTTNEKEAIGDVLDSVRAYVELQGTPLGTVKTIKNEDEKPIGWFKLEPPRPFDIEYLPVELCAR